MFTDGPGDSDWTLLSKCVDGLRPIATATQEAEADDATLLTVSRFVTAPLPLNDRVSLPFLARGPSGAPSLGFWLSLLLRPHGPNPMPFFPFPGTWTS